MGVCFDSQNSCSWRFVTRRKKVNHVVTSSNDSEKQLAKELTIPLLMARSKWVRSGFMYFSLEFFWIWDSWKRDEDKKDNV